jgi:hypothetical protein
MIDMSTRNPLQPPSRTLHLVDVENLLGTPRPNPAMVAPLADAYAGAAGLAPQDQVVLASSHICARSVWFGWPSSARRLVASGPDGADKALLGVLADERVAERFSRIVIGSGDGIFAIAAAQAQQAGAEVTVVCGAGAVARRLQMAVRDIRPLATPAAWDNVVALRRAA